MPPERASTRDFEHAPLQQHEIRLLEVRPGFEYDEVRCKLLEVPIDQAPPYAAISYRWGTTADRMSIRVGSYRLEVMPNAYWAIHYQRTLAKWRFIWIDCICINQSDSQERNHQVAIMGQIFSRAAEVIVWLGLHDPGILGAFERLRDVFRLQSSNALYTQSNETYVEGVLAFLVPLLSADYWGRIWIIQEVLFASSLTLMCGDQHLPWENFATAVLSHPKEIKDMHGNWAAVNALIAQRRMMQTQNSNGGNLSFRHLRLEIGNDQNVGLETLLHEFSYAECSDPRDKVFALLEIWNRRTAAKFEADYTKSVRDVLLTTFAFVVEHSNPDYFTFCADLQGLLGHRVRCVSDLPEVLSLSQHGTTTFRLDNHETIKIPALVLFGYPIAKIVAVYDGGLHPANLDAICKWFASLEPEVIHYHWGSEDHLKDHIDCLLTAIEQSWTDQTDTPFLYMDDLASFGLAFPRPQIGDRVCAFRDAELLVTKKDQSVVGAARGLDSMTNLALATNRRARLHNPGTQGQMRLEASQAFILADAFERLPIDVPTQDSTTVAGPSRRQEGREMR